MCAFRLRRSWFAHSRSSAISSGDTRSKNGLRSGGSGGSDAFDPRVAMNPGQLYSEPVFRTGEGAEHKM